MARGPTVEQRLKEGFRALARKRHHVDGVLEIDLGAEVSLPARPWAGDGKLKGAYVAAWVWVDADGLDEALK